MYNFANQFASLAVRYFVCAMRTEVQLLTVLLCPYVRTCLHCWLGRGLAPSVRTSARRLLDQGDRPNHDRTPRLLVSVDVFAFGGKGEKLKRILLCLLFCAGTLMAAAKTVYDFTLNSIEGQAAPLAVFKGKVLLLVGGEFLNHAA